MTRYMKISGTKEVIDTLESLGGAVRTKLAREATRNTLNETTLDKAKNNATTMVGGDMGILIANNLKIITIGKKSKGTKGSSIVIDEAGNKDFVYITKKNIRHYIPFAIEYGHSFPGNSDLLRNFGTKRRRRRTRSQIDEEIKLKESKKEVAPIPFMRKAFESSKTNMITTFGKKIVESIEKHVAKVAKKNAKAESFVMDILSND